MTNTQTLTFHQHRLSTSSLDSTSTSTSAPTLEDFKHSEGFKKIIVVAFGAFDRYYVCWEDIYGQYHQERRMLPDKLEQWLFPPDGSTRDFKTLQVSLGHNDEFFAFDQFGKISNRDVSKRGSVHGSPGLRAKSYTFSGSRPDESLESVDQKISARRLERPRSMAGAALMARWALRAKRSSAVRMKDIEDDGDYLPRSQPSFPVSRKDDRSIGISVLEEESNRSSLPSRYVDAGVQTDSTQELAYYSEFGPTKMAGISDDFIRPGHPVRGQSFGMMQDYFRKQQYHLGDSFC